MIYCINNSIVTEGKIINTIKKGATSALSAINNAKVDRVIKDNNITIKGSHGDYHAGTGRTTPSRKIVKNPAFKETDSTIKNHKNFDENGNPRFIFVTDDQFNKDQLGTETSNGNANILIVPKNNEKTKTKLSKAQEQILRQRIVKGIKNNTPIQSNDTKKKITIK